MFVSVLDYIKCIYDYIFVQDLPEYFAAPDIPKPTIGIRAKVVHSCVDLN